MNTRQLWSHVKVELTSCYQGGLARAGYLSIHHLSFSTRDIHACIIYWRHRPTVTDS
jgi:hypothetical protein